MARVYVYERAVNAVSVDATVNNNLNYAENGIAVKQEPLDPDIDKPIDLLHIANKDTAVESKLPNVRNRNETISYNLKKTIKRRRKNVTETLKKIKLRSSKKFANYFECDVCHLSFYGETTLRQHKTMNLLADKSVSYCCDICNGMFLSHSVLNKHKEYCIPSKGQNTCRRRKYICNFCERKFSTKDYLQSHLFHVHEDMMSSNETLANKVKQDAMVDVVNTCKANICRTPEKPKENQNNMSLKRMRQTTLTEFLPLFGKYLIKKQEEASTNADKISVTSMAIKNGEHESLLNVSSSNDVEGTAMDNVTSTERRSLTDKKPFVQIHVNTNTMLSLLSDNMKVEDDHKSLMVAASSNALYNFRRLRSDCRPSPYERNGAFVRRARGKKTELWEKEMKTRFNCKECVIRLERCDGVISGGKLKTNDPECFCEENDPERVKRNVTTPGNQEVQTAQAESAINESIDLTKKKVFKCKVCKKLFISKENMHEHIDLSHVAYMSSICSARFTSVRKLLQHYLHQHEVFRRKKCCVCYEKLDSLNLTQHMSLHCIKIVRSKHDKLLLGNKRNCNEFRKRNRCKYCGKRFWLKSCLIQHRQISHPAEKTAPTVEKQVTSIAVNIEHSQCDSGVSKNHYNPKSAINTPSANTKAKSPVKESRGQSTASSNPYNSANAANHKRLISGIACVKGYQVDATAKDKIKFPCSICDKQFQTFQNLCMHERTFNKPANNPCTICGTGFSTKRLLQLHLLATHTPSCTDNYKYFCTFCNQGFAKKSNVQIHERHFHANKVAANTVASVAPQNVWNMNTVNTVCTVCTVCNIVFESYERFIEHNMYYYKGHVFTCTFCGKSFQGMYMLHHHNKLVHYPEDTRSAYTYTCDTCNEGFNQESHFHAHKLHVHLHEASSTQNSTVSPQNCAAYQDHNYAVTTDDGISANATIRVPIMTYSCDICSLNFTNEKDLSMHEKEYSADGDFQCEKCGKKCGTPTFLIKHQSLNHSGSDVGSGYKCRFCGEISTTSTAMVCHEKHFHGMNLQLESKDNASEQLEDANRNAPTENLVPRAEDELSKCICSTCGMRFLNEIKLKEHLLEYSDIGAFVCDICHRRFAEKYRLDVHKIKHSTLNHVLSEHHCPICQEGFTSAAHVRTHVMHLHGYETFSSAISKCTNNPNVNARSLNDPGKSRRIDGVQETSELDRSNGNNQNMRSNSLLNGTRNSSTHLNTSESLDDSDISIISVNEVHKNKVKCSDCGLVFNSSLILTRHKLRFVNHGDYACQHCDRRFPTLTIFNSHLIKHSADFEKFFLKYKCSYCDEKFKTPVSAYSHTAHVHGRNKPRANSIGVSEQINKTDTNCSKLSEKGTLDISERVFTDDDLEWLINDDTSSKGVATKLNGRQKRNSSIEATHENRINKMIASPLKSCKKDSINCLICNATCADELDLKTHLEKVHLPPSPIDQTLSKTIDTVDASCTADDSDIVEIIWEKTIANAASSENKLKLHGDCKLEIEATNVSCWEPSIEEQSIDKGDVGKLKVKSFAKITD